MILFTIYALFTKMLYGGDGRKIQKTKQKKKFPVWLPSHPPVYEVEADYCPVSENTENKPDLP